MGYCSCQQNPIVAAMRNPTVYAMRNPHANPDMPWDFSHTTPVNKKVIKINYPFQGLQAQEFKTALMYMFSDDLMYNPEWRGFVAQIVRDSGASHNPVQMAYALSNWLERHINYLPEPGELIQDPRNTIRYHVGDCDDFAAALNAMLESAGFITRIVWIQHKLGWHVYTEAKFSLGDANTKWIPLDPSMPPGKKGFETPRNELVISHPVDRAIASTYAMPQTVAIALTADDDEVFEIEGGLLGKAGVRYITQQDMLRLPEDASGKLFDKIKKAAPMIKAAIQKVFPVAAKLMEGAKKLLKNPVFQKLAQTAARFIPGAGPAIAKALEIAGKVIAKVDNVIEQKNKIQALAKGLMDKGDAKSKIMAKALEMGGNLLAGIKERGLEGAAKDTILSLKQQFIQGKLADGTTPVQTLGELAQSAPDILGKVADVARQVAQVGEMGGSPVEAVKAAISESAGQAIKSALSKTLAPLMEQITGQLGQFSEEKDKRAGAVSSVLSKVSSALLGGKRAVPYDLQKAADAAINIDTWLGISSSVLGELESELDKYKNTPDYERNNFLYLQYKSVLIDALTKKEDLIRSAASKLNYQLPQVDLKTMDLKDLMGAVNMNQLGSIGLIMLSVPKVQDEIMAFKGGVEALGNQAKDLSDNLMKLKSSIVARTAPGIVMQPRSSTASNYVEAPA